MASTTVAQVQLVLRLTLGLIFIGAALAKLRDPAAFVQGVQEYQVLPPPLARLYPWLVPFVEFGTGILLLGGFLLPVAASLAVLLLLTFAVAIIVVTVRGRVVSCHCFGASERGLVGWHTLVRDVVLLIHGLWLVGERYFGRITVEVYEHANKVAFASADRRLAGRAVMALRSRASFPAEPAAWPAGSILERRSTERSRRFTRP